MTMLSATEAPIPNDPPATGSEGLASTVEEAVEAAAMLTPPPATVTVEAEPSSAMVDRLTMLSAKDTATDTPVPEAPEVASAPKVWVTSPETSVIDASTVKPEVAVTAPATAARLDTLAKLIATAIPTAPDPPSAADPSALAFASVLADDRTVTEPPAMIVTPVTIVASEEVSAMLIATAAPTAIGPSEVDADGVAVEPEPDPPLLVA